MKTVVITGASRGIGLAVAKIFLSKGWKVIGTYLTTKPSFEHENLIWIIYDQSSPKSIKETSAQIARITKSIHALINNAGVLLDADDMVADSVKIRKTLEVNVVGVIDLTERLLPLLEKGSHILNINSGYGSFSFPIDDESATGYRLSKAALNMYTRHLAFRLQSRGIIVSSVRPGWVKTDMGYSIATKNEGPTIEPHQAAEDIFRLITNVKETGGFWANGERHEW